MCTYSQQAMASVSRGEGPYRRQSKVPDGRNPAQLKGHPARDRRVQVRPCRFGCTVEALLAELATTLATRWSTSNKAGSSGRRWAGGASRGEAMSISVAILPSPC